MTKRMVGGFGGLLAALLLALCLAGEASAGGWSVVVLDSESALIGVDRPIDAGAPFTVGFTVLQHGKTPVSGLTPKITLTNAALAESVTAFAEGEGGPGHYVATITLPEAGTWTWQIDAFGPVATMAPLAVAAPAPAPAPAQPAPALALWATLAALVIALLALGVRAARARQPAVAP